MTVLWTSRQYIVLELCSLPNKSAIETSDAKHSISKTYCSVPFFSSFLFLHLCARLVILTSPLLIQTKLSYIELIPCNEKRFWLSKMADEMETIKWRLSKALRDVNTLPTWEALVSKVHKITTTAALFTRYCFIRALAEDPEFDLQVHIEKDIFFTEIMKTFVDKGRGTASTDETRTVRQNNRTLPTRLLQQLSIRESNAPWLTIQSISIRRVNSPYMLFEQHSNTSIKTTKQNSQLSPTRQ